MNKIVFILIFIFLCMLSPAKEVLEDIVTGRIFVVDNDGYIYVNSGEHTIVKYSPTGQQVLEMSRKGEGPSDIKRLGWFAINPTDNNIYVTEFIGGNKWLSKFSTDGKYIGEFNCQIDWKKCEGILFINFDKKGNIYLELNNTTSRRCKDFLLITSEKGIIKFSPDGKKIKDIYRFHADNSAEMVGKGNVTIPFQNTLTWTVYNENVIVRESVNGFISIFDLEGNLRKKVPLPFKREKVTTKDLDDWVERMKSVRWVKNGIAEGWFDLNFWRRSLPFPEYKPVSAYSMLIDSQGFLYSLKYPDYDDGRAVGGRIDLSTGNLHVIKFRQGEWLLATWKNYFFVQKLNDEDNYVVTKIEEQEFLKGLEDEEKYNLHPKP